MTEVYTVIYPADPHVVLVINDEERQLKMKLSTFSIVLLKKCWQICSQSQCLEIGLKCYVMVLVLM